MAKNDFIEPIGRIDKVNKEIEKVVRKQVPDKDHFDNLMQKNQAIAEPNAITEIQDSKKTHFDVAKEMSHNVNYTKGPNPNDIVVQAEDAMKRINEIKSQLESPEFKLKDSTQTVLRNHLSHIDESLKIALTKAGLEFNEADAAAGFKPLDRFLSLLTHGQYQLQNLANEIQSVHLKEGELSPTSMLMIQIKVNYIQQELELFSNMLNKSLESLKTIMNVQV